MQFTLATIAGLAVTMASATSISVTPHDQYSSSVGVLGCKIDTNRVAYWPSFPSCGGMCVKVSNGDRSMTLLHIDQSGGAYDISYNAWNYLVTGNNATTDPTMGGGVDMDYEEVDMSECADIIKTEDGRLGFEAANSINFIASCLTEPSSWVAQNYALFNIFNSVCTYGIDEECTLDLNVSNQPACPSMLGLTVPLTTCPVYNIAYGTGAVVKALA